jgi:carbon storage regulator
MLVLTRKKGESIMIGNDIELIVLGTEGDTVKVGIAAPKHVQVYRKELYDSIQQSNKEASQNTWNTQELGKVFKNK